MTGTRATGADELPLAGIRVLDLSRVLAGPWAAMTLGDLGAEVIKVEAPGKGDDTRAWTPPEVGGISTYYLGANRNKKSIAIDLKSCEGRAIVLDLVRKVDVVVENFLPASLERLGLGPETLRAVNPGLIHCSITGYGRDSDFADRPGYDFILQAETGFMSITGEPEGRPMRLGVAFIDLVTGMNATQAILAALVARTRNGTGRHIDIALHHSGLHFLANVASGYLNTGQDPERYGNAHPSIVPYQLFDTADGALALAVGNDGQFRRLCIEVLNDPGLAADSRYQNNGSRVAHRNALVEQLSRHFGRFKTDDVLALLWQHGIPAGRVNTVSQAIASDEARSRDVIVETEHPEIGRFRSIRSPLRTTGASGRVPSPPPGVGRDSREILASILGWTSDRIDAALRSGAVGATGTTACPK